METPLHFDGHGVNDVNGDRIFKLSIRQWDQNGQGLDSEFVRLSNLFAAAPELLEALQKIIDMNPGTYNQDYAEILSDCKEIARAAIAKATGS